MASASSAFKVKCPSCEAMVSIRDAGLAGKKVDCPKCKYRFVVELPAGAAGDDDDEDEKPAPKAKPSAKPPMKKRDNDDEPKAASTKPKNKPLPKRDDDDENEEADASTKTKKKAGANSTLLIGGGLGALAILVLVGAWLGGVFDGDEPKKDSPAPPITNQSKGEVQPPVVADNNPPKKAGTIQPIADAAKDDITNLLPKDSQWILKVNGREFLDTPVGAVLFEDSGEAATAFKRLMGFAGDDVEKFVCSGKLDATGFFGVLRLKRPVKIDELKSTMDLDAKPKTIKSRNLYAIKSNDLFKMLGEYMTAKMNALVPNLIKADAGSRDLALNLLDSQTLVFGDRKAIEPFLEADAKRPQLTKYAPPELNIPSGTGIMGSTPMNPTTGMMGTGMMGTGMMGTPAISPMGMGMMGTTPGPTYSASPSYLTVDPSLKKILNHLEADKATVISFAVKVDELDKFVADLQRPFGTTANVQLPKSTVIAFIVKQVDSSKLSISAGMEFQDSFSAQQITAALQGTVGFFSNELSKVFHVPIGPGQGGMGTTPSPMVTATPMIRPPFPVGMGTPPSTDPNAPPEPVTSLLKLTSVDRAMVIELDVDWKKVYFSYISPTIRSQIDLLKGEALMMTGRAHWHTIASGLKGMELKGMVPMAAAPRQTNSARFDLPYPAVERVSWMADLLPYLGYETLSRRINRQASWNDDSDPLPDGTTNLRAGSAWISEFLNPEYPDSTWRAQVPSLKGRDLGATHFVGLTGIGMDSGEYPDTPEYAKKLGMFGFNRQAKFSDIVTGDGTANTIFLIQVPPNIQRPWIRGGGSTAQGVLEKESIKPFVSTTKGAAKGTYAMMADGSIRFISETIDDKVFQALVTYKGGEKIDNLDQVAPPEKSKNTSALVGKSPSDPPIMKTDPDKLETKVPVKVEPKTEPKVEKKEVPQTDPKEMLKVDPKESKKVDPKEMKK